MKSPLIFQEPSTSPLEPQTPSHGLRACRGMAWTTGDHRGWILEDADQSFTKGQPHEGLPTRRIWQHHHCCAVPLGHVASLALWEEGITHPVPPPDHQPRASPPLSPKACALHPSCTGTLRSFV